MANRWIVYSELAIHASLELSRLSRVPTRSGNTDIVDVTDQYHVSIVTLSWISSCQDRYTRLCSEHVTMRRQAICLHPCADHYGQYVSLIMCSVE